MEASQFTDLQTSLSKSKGLEPARDIILNMIKYLVV